jgi:hypothetical protein
MKRSDDTSTGDVARRTLTRTGYPYANWRTPDNDDTDNICPNNHIDDLAACKAGRRRAGGN